jgi:hypothetical protein
MARRALFKENIDHIDNIPEIILKTSFESEREFKNFACKNDKYTDLL